MTAALLLTASLAYLVTFVPRGWIPHDEGMIGQSAELVLLGAIPHVDYEEPYTGALTWLYAGLFRATGTDLLHVRWLLFFGASLALWTTYAILRRHLDAIGAAFGSVAALVWSFPNYFAGLPSWWLLVAALICLWTLVRYAETGAVRYVVLGALVAGTSILIKQTGLYLAAAFLLSLAYQSGAKIEADWREVFLNRAARWGAATFALLVALGLLSARFGLEELLYLLLPIAACSAMLVLPEGRQDNDAPRRPWVASLVVGLACAMLPLGVMTLAYAWNGHLREFIDGVFVLPRKRLVFASVEMPPAILILAGAIVFLLMLPLRPARAGHAKALFFTRVALAAAIAVLSVWNMAAYQLVWQSSRAVAALVPVAVLLLIALRHITDPRQRHILFASSAMLAWASLVQFPFGAAVYFCYVTPLALIASVAAARAWFPGSARVLLPWGVLLVMFGVLSLNRGYIDKIGTRYQPVALDASLDLPRARLEVSAADSGIYRQVVGLVETHRGGGVLVAEPDCPEVYFLTGTFSPRGTFFDFFSDEKGDPIGSRVSVVVINHDPFFSPPVAADRLSELRREFPSGDRVDRFEIRWR